MSGTGRSSASGRVLITGGAGFIGNHLTSALIARDVQVNVVDDLRVMPLLPLHRNLQKKRVLDMTVDDVLGVDVVYHLASHKSVPESFVHPLPYLENIESTSHLLDISTRAGVRAVFVASTCEVYGNARTIPTPEIEPLAPLSPYAWSKVGMEMVTRTYQEAAVDTSFSILRLFNVFGPGERPDALIPSFCASALSVAALRIEGSGKQRRDFSYITDTVRKLVELAYVNPERILNIGSGSSASVLDIAATVTNLCRGISLNYAVGLRDEISEFLANTSSQTCLLGSPKPATLTEGIRETLEWWRAKEQVGVTGNTLTMTARQW